MTYPNNVTVSVGISKNNGGASWSFQSNDSGFDEKTGKLTLLNNGPAQITYQLDSLSAPLFDLVFINLDQDVCATHQIEQVTCSGNSIVIIDKNTKGVTNKTPFSLRLIAREAGNIGAPFLSPDPGVENDPDDQCP